MKYIKQYSKKKSNPTLLHGLQFWCRPSNQYSGCIKSYSKKRNTDLIYLFFSFSINDISGQGKRCLQQVRDKRENASGNRDECFLVILKLLLPGEYISLLSRGVRFLSINRSLFQHSENKS